MYIVQYHLSVVKGKSHFITDPPPITRSYTRMIGPPILHSLLFLMKHKLQYFVVFNNKQPTSHHVHFYISASITFSLLYITKALKPSINNYLLSRLFTSAYSVSGNNTYHILLASVLLTVFYRKCLRYIF